MISVDKMEVFALVVKAVEKNDNRTASELMRIISKSIQQDRENNSFSERIEISNKKDEQLIKRLIQKASS